MQGLKPPKNEQSDRRLVTGSNRGDCVCVFQEVGLPGKEDRRSDSGSGERGPLAGCGERRLHHPSHPGEPFPDDEIRRIAHCPACLPIATAPHFPSGRALFLFLPVSPATVPQSLAGMC